MIFISVQEYFNKKERQKLSEALIAKNLREIADLEITRKTKPAKEEETVDAVLESDLSDEEFAKSIKVINGTK